MALNRRFGLYITAYSIGILVSLINYDVAYEVRFFGVILIAVVGFYLFNTLMNKWLEGQGT